MNWESLIVSIGGGALIWVASSWAAGREAKAISSGAGAPDAAGARSAGFWIRAAARMADYLLIWLFFFTGVFLIAILEATNLVSGRAWATCLVLLPAAFLTYFAVLTARSGQTWGKRLAGVVVEKPTGGRLGWGRSLARAAADLVFTVLWRVLVGYIDPLWVAANRRRRALHDLVAGTCVRTLRVPSRMLPWMAALGCLSPFMLVFGAIRPFVAQAFFIPSGAMAPTVREGDRILVNKLAYRMHSVERGDIVVFDAPAAARGPGGPRRDFIKRVVGVPGDRVEIRRGHGVLVNGARLRTYPMVPPEYDWPVDSSGNPLGQPYLVPDGTYFVLGDNCNVSNDSHSWRDPDTGEPAPQLSRASILGKASVRLWPPERIGEVH